ncbi:MAG: TolC family protein [Gammaproteobacteria bacterium]|nr:TolC family protein [Gammaproteobacteria bacterium]
MFPLSRPVAVALLLFSWANVQAQTPLTLAEAERLALANDVAVRESQAQAQALREQAVADGQLPDPALTLGAMSLPVDTLSRSTEPMTQLSVGISQAFPPGATLEHQAARTTHMAGAADAEAAARERGLLRDVREAYLELGYQSAALQVLADTRRVLVDIVAVTKSLYRVGRANLQDVLSAQLEQSLLDDREHESQAERDAALAGLQRWTGTLPGDVAAPAGLPELATPPTQEQLQAQLEAHPMVAAASARVAAGQEAVEAARQQYKPGWMVNVSYGDRIGREADGMPRSDLVTAMVTMDLPLFPGKRQDRRVAASVGEAEAMRFARDGVHRDLAGSVCRRGNTAIPNRFCRRHATMPRPRLAPIAMASPISPR